MKFLSLTITALLLTAASVGTARADTTVESLRYDVFYHWGIIWKKAGSGILTLDSITSDPTAPRLRAQLAGRSLSIVETFMKVRDTLISDMNADLVPLKYAKLTHEGSYHAWEINRYSYDLVHDDAPLAPANIDSTIVHIDRWRNKKGSNSARRSVAGSGYDMLSIFYVIRHLDYAHMTEGTKLQYPIFSGINMTWMYVEFRGRTICEMRDGRKLPAYRLELYFKSRDSDHTPIQAWLDANGTHKPLKVLIQLRRVGSIQGEIVE